MCKTWVRIRIRIGIKTLDFFSLENFPFHGLGRSRRATSLSLSNSCTVSSISSSLRLSIANNSLTMIGPSLLLWMPVLLLTPLAKCCCWCLFCSAAKTSRTARQYASRLIRPGHRSAFRIRIHLPRIRIMGSKFNKNLKLQLLHTKEQCFGSGPGLDLNLLSDPDRFSGSESRQAKIFHKIL